MADLEGTKVPEGETKPTLKEVGQSTAKEDKPTVGKYTQEDLDKAIGKATESLNRNYTLARTEAQTLKAKLEAKEGEVTRHMTRLKKLETDFDKLEAEKFEDYPDEKTRRQRERELERRQDEILVLKDDVDKKMWAINMSNRASQLSTEFNIPVSEFDACKSEGDMTDKVLQFLKTRKDEPAKVPEETKPPTKPPTFDSNISTGAGGAIYQADEVIRLLDPSKMTPAQIHAQILELEKAAKEGRIKT